MRFGETDHRRVQRGEAEADVQGRVQHIDHASKGPCVADLLFEEDGVRREEASITTGLNPHGCLVVNGDDEKLVSIVGRYKGRKITFGFKDTNELFATDTVDSPGVTYDYLAQVNQTDWEFLKERARALGYSLYFSEGKLNYKYSR